MVVALLADQLFLTPEELGSNVAYFVLLDKCWKHNVKEKEAGNGEILKKAN